MGDGPQEAKNALFQILKKLTLLESGLFLAIHLYKI